MPESAKENNDVNVKKVNNHRLLTIVGDSICAAYLMLNKWNKEITSGKLITKKESVFIMKSISNQYGLGMQQIR